MLVIFAGGMCAAALLGEPILAPLKNSPQLLVATACWYVVFYTPFDIGYKVAKFLPVKLVASAMKEIYRAKKIHDGVSHAAKLWELLIELCDDDDFLTVCCATWTF